MSKKSKLYLLQNQHACRLKLHSAYILAIYNTYSHR